MPKSKEFLTTSDSESGDSDEPKQKKKKSEAKPKKEVTKVESDKAGTASGPTKGPGGEYMFSLAKLRFATVSEFRGKVMVGIREYYEKDGQLRPGKKGISLSADQWQALKDNIAEIDQCMKNF